MVLGPLVGAGLGAYIAPTSERGSDNIWVVIAAIGIGLVLGPLNGFLAAEFDRMFWRKTSE